MNRYGSSFLPPNSIELLNGDTTGRIEQIAIVSFSIANSATTDYNLRSGLTDLNNVAFSIQTLRYVELYMDAVPGAVWFGPQGRTNAMQAWYHGVDTDDREKVGKRFLRYDETGWTVGASAHTLAIANSSGSTITGKLILAGVAV